MRSLRLTYPARRRLLLAAAPLAALIALGACGSDDETPSTGAKSTSGGSAGETAGGAAGSAGASTAGAGGASTAGAGGASTAGSAGASTAGSAGASTAGSAGASTAGSAGASTAGSAGASTAGAGGGGQAGAPGGAGGSAAGAGGSGQAGSSDTCLYPSTPSKTCSKDDDCAVVRGPSWCPADYLGVRAEDAPAFEAASAAYRACTPPPPCAVMAPATDDGSVPLHDGDAPVVRCDVGQCRSSFIAACTTPPEFSRACTKADDCVAVEEPDCCSTRVRGIASSDSELASVTFKAFVSSCRACEVVDCAGVGRIADDDSVAPDGMPNAAAKVLCDAGTCKTTFTN